MTKHRTPYAVALAFVALIASSIAAGAAPTRATAPDAGTSARQPSGSAQEYVVAFTGSSDAAVATVTKAGGQVVSVNEGMHLALVETKSSSFASKVSGATGVRGVIRNHAVGETRPGMAHRYAANRPNVEEEHAAGKAAGSAKASRGRGVEPLANLQWDMQMIGATPTGAWKKATGKGVDVAIIDTGIDASHPDIAPNFDSRRSRNFTMDIPGPADLLNDGPCEVPTCIDPANVDDGGHGTHVAGTVAAARNGLGIAGVAPDVKLINLRAGQDSGFFFLYETVAALTEAGNLHVDVVNMSFFTDPWLYNCASRDDYISGEVSDAQIAEQALIRQLVLEAVKYASDRGVTLVGAAGNEHANMALPTRADLETSPDFPALPDGTPVNLTPRVVKKSCLDLPNEAPQVIGVSSVGPSTTKADYSNYGLGDVEVSAPGGWFRDFFGTPQHRTNQNLILSSYPLHVAIEEGLADENGNPTDDSSVKSCNSRGVCGFYHYLQGTSMASPHAAGVAALIIDRFGHHTRGGGRALSPTTVQRIMERTATDHACPAGGVEDYTDEGRDPSFNAVCDGTTAENGLYGEGIVSAVNAVR